MLVYAIDFGTTNSLLAASDGKQVFDPIPLDLDARDPSILRSILYFPNVKECYYGVRAMTEFMNHDMEGRLIRSIKKFLPVRSFLRTYIDDRPMLLEDIIGLFLRELRERANRHFGQDVDTAVIGRPARFATDDADDAFAQSRLEKSARMAGFKYIEFCPEPVAAAREYRKFAKGTKEQTVLVADFGGGTSDYTIIKIGEKPFQDSDVLAIGGVALAGDSLDGALMKNKLSYHFGAEVSYQVPFGSNILTMPRALMESICSPADISLLRKRDTMEFFRNVKQWSLGANDRVKMDQLFALIDDQLGFSFFEEIENTKRRLSDQLSTEFHYDHPFMDVRELISRDQYDGFTADRIEKILASLDATVKAAGIQYSDVDLVCCTGGTAKVPALKNAIAQRFGEHKMVQHNHFHSVVQGLAEKARDLADS